MIANNFATKSMNIDNKNGVSYQYETDLSIDLNVKISSIIGILE